MNTNIQPTLSHFEVNNTNISQIDVHLLQNNNGAIINGSNYKLNDAITIIAPQGNWQWWTSDDGIKYKKQFIFQSVPPDFFHINIILTYRISNPSWGRWTKV